MVERLTITREIRREGEGSVHTRASKWYVLFQFVGVDHFCRAFIKIELFPIANIIIDYFRTAGRRATMLTGFNLCILSINGFLYVRAIRVGFMQDLRFRRAREDAKFDYVVLSDRFRLYAISRKGVSR